MADITCETCGAPAVEVIVRQWVADVPVCARCAPGQLRSMVVHGVKGHGIRRVDRIGRHAVVGGMVDE